VAALSRKQLKQDRFVEVVGQEVALFQRHRTAITVAAAAIIALIVGGYSYAEYRARAREEARVALNDAVRLFHGVVTVESRPGFVTYATSGERVRRVTEALDKVVAEHSGTEAAYGARYYQALLDIEQGKYDDAAPKLAEAADKGGESYGSLARLAWAETLGRQGKTDEARKQFDALISKPTSVVPRERAQLALATMLADKDPEAAKPILQELMSTPGAVSVAAGTVMRRIQGA
jgi:tetratricopeptide (TPR) repeat protein